MPALLFSADSTLQLANVVTADMLSSVLDEMIGLLPVVIPVSIGYIAIRKGLSFLFGSLRRA